MKDPKGLEKILEEFDNKPFALAIRSFGGTHKTLGAIKDFISSVYQQGREDMKEEVERWANEELKRNEKAPCKNEHRKPTLGEVADRYSCAQLHIGYEECLSDLLSHLTEMKK